MTPAHRGLPIAVLALAYFGLPTAPAFAQPADQAPATSLVRRQPQFRALNLRLPGPHVTAFAQDAEARIWIGTSEGLAVFDGETTTAYNPSAAEPVALTAVTALAWSSGHGLVVGTEGEGLWRRDLAGRFDNVIPAETTGAIRAIALAGDDVAVVAGAAGLFRVSLRDGGVARIGDDVLVALVVRRSGGLVGASASGQFVEIARTGAVTPSPHELSGDTINGLAEDAAGRIWVATDRGAVVMTASGPRRFDADDGLDDSRATFVIADADGAVWIGTDAGIGRIEERTLAGEYFRYEPGVPGTLAFHALTSAFVDRDGLLWIGHFTMAISLHDPRRAPFRSYLLPGAVASFKELGRQLWLGSYAEGIVRYDLKTGASVAYRRAGPLDRQIDISALWKTDIEAFAGRIWVGTSGAGLVGLDPRTGESILLGDDSELGTNEVFALAVVGDRLWIGTWGEGLYAMDADGSLHEIEVPSDHIYSITPARRAGAVWLGTGDQGAVLVEPGRTPRSFATTAPLEANRVVTAVEAPDGKVWLATWGAGLRALDPATGTQTAVEGLERLAIAALVADPTGKLWLATSNDGLYRYDPATGRRDHLPPDAEQGYGEAPQNGMATGEGGIVYLGTKPGFQRIATGDVRFDRPVPRPRIGRISTIDGALDAAHATVRHDEPMLRIEFSAPIYAASDIHYQYQLSGVNAVWIDTHEPSVVFSRLPAGTYQFRVRAVDAFGRNGDEIATASFTVRPPPWRTGWAYAAYGALAAAVAVAVVRGQRARLQRARQAARLAAVEREIELTGAVQTGFLPALPGIQVGPFSLHGLYRPADVCGGDWWWYERTGGSLLVLVGDVTGHGVGPAMVTAAAASAFRTTSGMPHLDLRGRLAKLHEEVIRAGRGTYNMTLSAIELDIESRRGCFYAAGGLPLLHLKPGAAPITIGAPSAALGGASLDVGEHAFELEAGDRIVLMTDGPLEQAIRGGRQLGMRRFMEMCRRELAGTPASTVQAITAGIDAERVGMQEDDWTITIVDCEAA